VAYGITIPDGIIATIIMAEADRAANSSGGKQVDRALGEIRLAYPYNYQHATASITNIVRHLTAADNVRNLADAPGPNNNSPGQANAVDAAMDHVRRLVFDDVSTTNDDTYRTAAAASSRSGGYTSEDDKSSKSYKVRGKGKATKEGRKKSKSKSRPTELTADNNPCKHCRRHGRRSRHPTVDSANCFWNNRYKGWRPRYVCRQLDMAYHDREYYMSDSGGEDTSDDK
jgi:hypothetical protein